MNKSHYVHIWFETSIGNYVFDGLVVGRETSGRLEISPDKLFFKAFGFRLPGNTMIYYN